MVRMRPNTLVFYSLVNPEVAFGVNVVFRFGVQIVHLARRYSDRCVCHHGFGGKCYSRICTTEF